MRIIAGTAKGRKLSEVRGKEVRPMTDQIREAVFSSIGEGIAGARFLDLFAGSGGVGLEALSRGAERVTFIEHDDQAVKTIRENLELTGLADGAAVIPEKVERHLRMPPAYPYDYVMVDPPFTSGLPSNVFNALGARRFLKPDAIVITRLESRSGVPENPRGFHAKLVKKYGDSRVIYFEYQAEDDEE